MSETERFEGPKPIGPDERALVRQIQLMPAEKLETLISWCLEELQNRGAVVHFRKIDHASK